MIILCKGKEPNKAFQRTANAAAELGRYKTKGQ